MAIRSTLSKRPTLADIYCKHHRRNSLLNRNLCSSLPQTESAVRRDHWKCGELDLYFRKKRAKPAENELDYFGTVIDQYIKNVFNNYNNLIELVIIAHPHRDHILNNYNYDVSQTIYSSINKSEFKSRIVLLKNLDKINSSFVDDYFIKEDLASHLTYDYYRIFMFKVFDFLNFLDTD